MLIAIILKQQSLLNNLRKELNISRELFKDMYDIYTKITSECKNK